MADTPFISQEVIEAGAESADAAVSQSVLEAGADDSSIAISQVVLEAGADNADLYISQTVIEYSIGPSVSLTGNTAIKRFDAGLRNSWWIVPQLSDSGIELRDKVIKAVRITGKVTNANVKVYKFGATEPIDVDAMEAGTGSATGMIAIPNTTLVLSTRRYQVNVPGAALHTVRVEGEWVGENIKDRIDEIEYEVAEQGVRR